MPKRLTLEDIREERQKLSSAINHTGDTMVLHNINETLSNLEWIFDEFNKHGKFNDEDGHKVNVYRSALVQEEQKGDQSGEIEHCRLVVARNGLRLMQQYIPRLKEISKRCIEVAGEEAVRTVCAPTQREGTDLNGQPYNPTPSEFLLPASLSERGLKSVVSKIKAAIG